MITIFLVGALAGVMGALLGLGGGILIVPILSLFLGVPIHVAIAASLVAVVATSTVAAIAYVRDEISNMRLGMLLEVATTLGAILGGLTAAHLSREVLSGVFGAALALMAGYILKGKLGAEGSAGEVGDPGLLGGRYFDPSLGRDVAYRVGRLPVGLGASFLAGNLSGMLGIGGGPVKVPVMTLAMGVPLKAAAATSNFMIGVTACASAALYYARGFVSPPVAVPVCLGVSLGAFLGARLAPRVQTASLARGLAFVLLALSAQMFLAAFGVRFR